MTIKGICPDELETNQYVFYIFFCIYLRSCMSLQSTLSLNLETSISHCRRLRRLFEQLRACHRHLIGKCRRYLLLPLLLPILLELTCNMLTSRKPARAGLGITYSCSKSMLPTHRRPALSMPTSLSRLFPASSITRFCTSQSPCSLTLTMEVKEQTMYPPISVKPDECYTLGAFDAISFEVTTQLNAVDCLAQNVHIM